MVPSCARGAAFARWLVAEQFYVASNFVFVFFLVVFFLFFLVVFFFLLFLCCTRALKDMQTQQKGPEVEPLARGNRPPLRSEATVQSR